MILHAFGLYASWYGIIFFLLDLFIGSILLALALARLYADYYQLRFREEEKKRTILKTIGMWMIAIGWAYWILYRAAMIIYDQREKFSVVLRSLFLTFKNLEIFSRMAYVASLSGDVLASTEELLLAEKEIEDEKLTLKETDLMTEELQIEGLCFDGPVPRIFSKRRIQVGYIPRSKRALIMLMENLKPRNVEEEKWLSTLELRKKYLDALEEFRIHRSEETARKVDDIARILACLRCVQGKIRKRLRSYCLSVDGELLDRYLLDPGAVKVVSRRPSVF